MRKYSLIFKEKEIEKTYQKTQLQEVRLLMINVVTIGFFVNYLVMTINSIMNERYEYLFLKIGMLGYLIIQYYIVRRFPSFIRMGFVITNHFNCILMFFSDDPYTHEIDLIKGVNQMGMETVILLSGEFQEAIFSILSLNIIRMVYAIIYSEIAFYVPHVTTGCVVAYYIYYFYKFHSARRSQFLLTLVDSQWDQIMLTLIQKTPYCILTFDEEQLQYNVKQQNNCLQLFENDEGCKRFLKESIYEGKTFETLLYQEIKKFQTDHKKRMNVDLFVKNKKRIVRIRYSIFFGNQPTILITFKIHKVALQKNTTVNIQSKYNSFMALFLKVLNSVNPSQEHTVQLIQMKRSLLFFRLISNLKDTKFNEKSLNLYENIKKIAEFYPDKRIYFESEATKLDIRTIPLVLYILEMFILENSIGKGTKIYCGYLHSDYMQIKFEGNFNLPKLKYYTQQLQYPLKMIINTFDLTALSITLQLNKEPLIPFKK